MQTVTSTATLGTLNMIASALGQNLLWGRPLADIQVKILGLPAYTGYLNTFFTSSIIVILRTTLFAVKVAKMKLENTV